MDLGLTGKIALVTGSSRGIGRGIALALAREGCDLLLTGRDREALETAAQSIRSNSRRAAIHVADLRDPAAPAILVEAARREFGGLDILINNAGTTKRGDFFALTDADWEEGYALKFFAHMRLARAAWPLLKERRGSLIAIAGTSGRKAGRDFSLGRPVKCPGAGFHKVPRPPGKRGRRQVNLHPSGLGGTRA